MARLWTWITRQDWRWQIVLVPLYAMLWLVWLVSRPAAWILREMGAQAGTGARTVLRPLLWPVVIIVGILLLASAGLGELAGALIQLILVLGIAALGAAMFMGLGPFRRN